VFWQECLPGKISSGEWIEKIMVVRPSSMPTDHHGNAIKESHELSWIELKTNNEKARLHRFVTSDGRIGASGHPDPKRIKLCGPRKYALTGKGVACQKCGQVGHDWPELDGVRLEHEASA
jgi:hypothetical protein